MTADDSILGFIKNWLWAPLLGLISWAWTHLNNKTVELRKYVDEQDTFIRNEVTRQRDVSAKIFDKMEETNRNFTNIMESYTRRSEDRHIELLTAMHTGLAGKMDK
jgi:hypothetical protein